jgi:hypothetical protein
MTRFILNATPENMILAVRAAKWLLDRPGQRDGILVYGERSDEQVFYVKRNKSSISVFEDRKPRTSEE